MTAADSVPEWLTAKRLEEILRKSEHDPSLTISDVEFKPVGKPGEFFASKMFRVGMRVQGQKCAAGASKSLIVKTLPDRGIIASGSRDMELFGKEVKMYSEYLPKMRRVLDDGGRNIMTPTCLHASISPNALIVLEDLTPDGWCGSDLVTSFEEVKPVTIKIARFHAASYILSKQKVAFEGFQTDIFRSNDPVIDWMFGNNLKAYTEAIRSWDGCEQFVEPFEKSCNNYQEKLDQIYSCSTAGRIFNVLNHGDFHAKNLLHKFNEETRIADTMFLDFQACVWSSPAIDLYYLLNNIVDYKTKARHADDIVALYYGEFCASLTAMGFLGYVPTKLDLQIELLQNGFLDVLHYTCFLQFRFIDFTKVPEEKIATGQVGNIGLESEEYQTIMKGVMPRYLYKGLLE